MTVGFEHHQETHVSSYNNDAREDFENSSSGSHLLGNPSSTSLTYPRLRHHHFPSRSHESSGSTPAGLLPRNSMLSFGSGNKHFSHRSDPSSLSGGRGPYGESETLSHQQTNRFLSLSSSASSSPSSSKLSPTSALWAESENSSVGMTATHHHQHHNHHQNDGLFESDPHPQNNFLSALNLDVNSTKNISTTYKSFSPLESIMNKSGIHMSSYKNFSQTNTSFNFPFEEMTSLQSDDNITEQSYFDNSTRDPVLAADGINSTSDSTSTVRGNIYATIIPVMLFFCVLAVLVNLIIVISARWCRKPMSPTLYFSISLALADAYAAFILATGLVINSLLPYVVKYNGVPMCLSLVVEAFRQGGVLVTVSHLLALAMNHWIGIVRPLHYAATMTRRTAWIVIIFSWICPITVILIYFSSVYGEGFQSQGCKKYDFLTKRAYRTFFASCFFAPLILMSFIYIHIFIIVRNHHTHRQRYQNTQQLKRNVKAVLTTMLVLGTYVIGWMPATLYSLIACSDCVYKPESLPNAVRYSMGFIGNFLVILKTLVDPVIYAARMSDIQVMTHY
ncbi:unnamed protein product [Orchesella dallaii]|uniref:G-protein coupled receptors family 1 profile domain-containing protein n=1 Tax=Orchesella dallaii TaxID=48710 RepID=A0ABP1QQ24_9HEXA